jgi:hypothetical protein
LQGAGHETLYELPAYKTTLQAAFDALRGATSQATYRGSAESRPHPMIAAEGGPPGAVGDE